MHYENADVGISLDLPDGWSHATNVRPLTFLGPNGRIGGQTQFIQLRIGPVRAGLESPEARRKILTEPGATMRADRLGPTENVVTLTRPANTEVSAVHDGIHYSIVYPNDPDSLAAAEVLKLTINLAHPDAIRSAPAVLPENRSIEWQPLLTLQITSDFALSLFVTTAARAMHDDNLAGVHAEYVFNIERISRLAQDCQTAISSNPVADAYLRDIMVACGELLDGLAQDSTSTHVDALKDLTRLYNVGTGHFGLPEHAQLQRALLNSTSARIAQVFNELLTAMRRQIGYVNGLKVESPNSACFIATVVFGSAKAPEVQALRFYRDSVLAQHWLGRFVTKLYYSGLGARVAGILGTRARWLLPILRSLLNRIVQRSRC